MTHDFVKRTMSMFLGLSIVMLAGYARAQAPTDVTGTWVGSTLRGASTMTLVLKQTGDSVTGTIVGAGTADGPVSGTVDGNTIRLRLDAPAARCPSEAPRDRAARLSARAGRERGSASAVGVVVSSP